MFQLLNPLYLFGLVIASVPFVLHLIGRRSIREKPYSSLFLIKEIKKNSSVWLRMKDIILMLLRTLFLLFLIFGFSHPLIVSPLRFLGKEVPEDIAILVDVSMSMGVYNQLSRTREEVLGIYRKLGTGNNTTIITFSNKIEDEKDITNRKELQAFLDNLKITYNSTNLYPPLNRAVKELINGKGLQKKIFIVSDFQKSGLKDIGNLSSSLPGKDIEVYASYIPTTENNVFFSGFKLEPSIPLPGLRINIYPNLLSSGIKQYPIEFFFDGTKRGIKEGGAQKKLFFTIEPEESGYKSGFFRTGKDSLELDNKHYFSFYIPEDIKILVVGKQDDYYFLSSALTPGIKTPIKQKTVTVNDLPKINLFQYDILILCNTKFNNYLKVQTEEFLRRGGGVLMVLGNAFSDMQNIAILENTTLVRENKTDKGFHSIRNVDTGFNPLSDFKEKGLKNLYDTKFFRYFTIESSLKTVIEARNGDPLMVAENLNGGKIIIIPYALIPQWTELPIKAIFVPLIYKLTFYLSRTREKNPVFKVGEPIKISTADKLENPFFLTPDNEKKIPSLSVAGGEINYMLKHTYSPGIYRFVSEHGDTIPVAVNVDERESQLEPLPFNELKLILPEINKTSQYQELSTSGKKWIDLFPLLLILAIICLGIELILENR
jgi:hypothetical protein